MANVSLSGTAKICFEAGKTMTIGGELRHKGELVPEADGWSPDIVEKLQRTGHLRLNIQNTKADADMRSDEFKKVDDEGGSQEGAPSASTRKRKGDDQ